jgi:MoxR-like ATPase
MSDPSDRQGSGAAAGAAAGLVGPRYQLRLFRQAVTLRRPVLLRGPPGVSRTTKRRKLAGHDHDAVHWSRYSTSLSVPVQALG